MTSLTFILYMLGAYQTGAIMWQDDSPRDYGDVIAIFVGALVWPFISAFCILQDAWTMLK